jgi:myo-inositol-1(or 4)-monophosphatase
MTELVLSPEEIKQLIAWARQAGQIALSYFGKVSPERKTDHTFLTQADLAVEQFLAEQIRATFPDHHLIGEEGSRGHSRSQAELVWALDPIDGTTAFVQGLPGWGVSLGLLRQGLPHFGLFYMPLLDDITYTAGPGQVFGGEQELSGRLRQDWADKGYLAIGSTAHADFQIDLKRTRALGSIGVNLVYTARGSATATLISKAHLWDLVAGAAILQNLGGELRYLCGRPVDYPALMDGRRIAEPIIAGHPAVLVDLPQKISSKPPAST